MEMMDVMDRIELLNMNGYSQMNIELIQKISEMKKLHSLDLGCCFQIDEKIMQKIGEMKKLRFLNMNHNRFMSDDIIGVMVTNGMKNLHTLSLNHCYQLTDEGIVHLTKLVALKSLSLMGCGPKITGSTLPLLFRLDELCLGGNNNLDFDVLKHLINLEKLQISCKNDKMHKLSFIENLVCLRVLNVNYEGNRIGTISIGNLIHLEELIVTRCRLGLSHPRAHAHAHAHARTHISNNIKLRKLIMNECWVGENDWKFIGKCKRIEELKVSCEKNSYKLTDELLCELAIGVESLKKLDLVCVVNNLMCLGEIGMGKLEYLCLSDVGNLEGVGSLQWLRKLHVNKCYINDAVINELNGLKFLEELHLHNAYISKINKNEIKLASTDGKLYIHNVNHE